MENNKWQNQVIPSEREEQRVATSIHNFELRRLKCSQFCAQIKSYFLF